MTVRADGKINEAAARQWADAFLDRARRSARTEGSSGGTVSDLRARKLSAEAELLEMNRRKRSGELVERAAIERAAEARGRWERDSWVAWAARVASTPPLGLRGVNLRTDRSKSLAVSAADRERPEASPIVSSLLAQGNS